MSADGPETPQSSGRTRDARPAGNPLWHRLRTWFLTGIVVAAPLSITIYLLWSFLSFVDDAVTPFIPERYNPEHYLPFSVPGIGLLALVVALTLLGFLTANLVGRSLIRLGEKILDRMPIVRSIYGTLKQVFEMVISTKSSSFKDVVLIEYPRPGQWSMGFVTNETKGEIQERTVEDVICVFIPMAPAPTGGFLVFVPKKDVIYLDMTIDEGMKYVFSAGLVVPTAGNGGKARRLSRMQVPDGGVPLEQVKKDP